MPGLTLLLSHALQAESLVTFALALVSGLRCPIRHVSCGLNQVDPKNELLKGHGQSPSTADSIKEAR